MDYLVISATQLEIQPLLSHYQIADIQVGATVTVDHNDHTITFLVTGVGMMQTAYYLALLFVDRKFDHSLQVGIAGSFDRSLQIGEVVMVTSQQYGDLGSMDGDEFLDIYDLNLSGKQDRPFQEGKLINSSDGLLLHPKLNRVSGLSVNQVSATTRQIAIVHNKFNTQLEVMEGVAFHFACLKAAISYSEIRGISNYVEARNMANWDLKGAVEQLNNYLLFWLKDQLI